nr:MAG TPA: Ferrichrome-iron receptor, Protein tonB BARREL, OUTER MEMBRANE, HETEROCOMPLEX [Caudoviricetes sp.]
MTNFDIYNADGAKVADNKPSPVTVGGLTPNTTYTGWKIAYAGAEAKADVPEFKTLPRKSEPKPEPKPAPKPEPKPEPKSEPKPAPKPEPKPAPIKLASFKIDKTEINGKVGEETTVTASDFLPADTTDQALKFFTENGGIATITYDHGTTYAVKLLNPGTTKLHFNANDNGGAHAEVTVNVTAAK